ncbi:hypothetical protein [Burkholderia gladioli]|uniref:hypothetical protein n=1 Tax=Burkholderia gladioli TaxID=28095 RepID=UPI00163FC390|nr:hypothetical protein [Burkholderia gladioli]
MNLRILKKLSKHAAPLLEALGDNRDHFRAEKGDSYTSVYVGERKHWERMTVYHGGNAMRGHVKFKVKRGERWIVMWPPRHPLKGTAMVGQMEGYYEPEWEEQTAWEALRRAVSNHFTDWDEDGPVWQGPKFDGPGDVLRAARAIAGDTR